MTTVLGPVLCREDESLPSGSHWAFQLKVDGFYGLLTHGSDGRVALLSRAGKQLGGSFPELLQAGKALPPGTTLAGEITLADNSGRLSFSALQERLASGPRLAKESSRRQPATLVVFDAAAWEGTDLCGNPFAARWERLVTALPGTHPYLQLVPQTADRDEAIAWLEHGDESLVEGVVAKDTRLPWRAGKRLHIKVKRRRTIDAVLIGWGGSGVAVLGLLDAKGEMHVLGTCHMGQADAKALAPLLQRRAEPQPPIRSRWAEQGIDEWVSVSPALVIEVSASRIDGARLRQPARFIRLRPDKSPSECRQDQLLGVARSAL